MEIHNLVLERDMCACFIDFEKAFDRVQHHKLMQILNKNGLDTRDIRIIGNLYWHQKAAVKVEDTLTTDIDICRGVRQGCILSPILFNIYSEAIFRDALEEENEGIIINGQTINNIRYADDTVILADSMNKLQHLMDKVNTACKDKGLKMNISKTKFMIISKTIRQPEITLKIENEEIEQVHQYKYLGCWLNDQWDHSQQIKSRIEIARNCFFKMRDLLCNREFNLELRIRILRCYILSVLFYGVETWTMSQATTKKIEAFEMWCYRRMLRISWVDKITNEEVLNRMKKDKELLYTIKKRKLEYFGHLMRGEKYEVIKVILQGKIQGKRSVGRRRISWLKNLREWFNSSTKSLFRTAADKVKIAMMLANLQRGEER